VHAGTEVTVAKAAPRVERTIGVTWSMILTAGLSNLRLGLGLIVTSTFGPKNAKFTSVAPSLSSSLLILARTFC
jgi:hypothetical protein